MHDFQLSGLVLAFLLSFLSGSAGSQIVVTDDLGRTVTLPGPAERIVSLAPSITESLWAVGAARQIAGVTAFCNYPPATAALPRVGGMINPSMETILSLSPDLIIVSMEGNTREDFAALTGLKIPVFVTNPRSLDGIYRSLEQLGTLTGHKFQATRLVDSLRTRENAVRSRTTGHSTRALLLVSLQPLIAVGRGTFLNALLELAGAQNPAAPASGTYPVFSRETLLSENPEVIVLTSDLLPDPRQLATLFPEWEHLAAVRTGRVYCIDPDIVSRPGPRALDGLEALATILHEKHP